MPGIVLPVAVAAVSLLIGWQSRTLGALLGLMDVPDTVRKFHGQPTPIVGGLMFLASAVILIGYYYTTVPWSEDGSHQRFFVIASIIIPHCILGLTDDRYSVPAAARLIYSLSLSAAVLVTDRSLSMRDVYFSFGVSIRLSSQFGYFVTLLFVVGLTYAVNMIDGVNGILGTYGLILTAVLARWLYPGQEFVFVSIILVLSIFLGFNLAGALFAGDGGSYAVGACAAIMLLNVYEPASARHPFPIDLIVVAVFVPVVDAVRVSVSRLLSGRSPFSADRNHLHHRLQRRFGNSGALAMFTVVVGGPTAVALAMPSITWVALIIVIVAYLGVTFGLTDDPVRA